MVSFVKNEKKAKLTFCHEKHRNLSAKHISYLIGFVMIDPLRHTDTWSKT